jgi:hypothetical protein
MESAQAHWDQVYRTKRADEVSWFQPTPATSLELVAESGAGPDTPVIDVGAGASALVDGLLDRGFRDITLLDIAEAALDVTRARLGARMDRVHAIVSDVTSFVPARLYGLWHDRAVFHFLVEEAARDAYRRVLAAAVAPGGAAIVATFAEDGPGKCSNLTVRRYSVSALAAELDPVLELVSSRTEVHTTPWGSTQSFVYGRFRRRAAP